MSNSNTQVICNVMEVLVAQEVARQISYHPETEHINSLEIISYALNRLPSLYATSEEGFNYQKLKGEIKLRNQIETVVKEALNAVCQDPYRPFQPLVDSGPQETKEERQIREILLEMNKIIPNKGSLVLLKTLKEILIKIMKDQLTTAEIKRLRSELCFDWGDTRYFF